MNTFWKRTLSATIYAALFIFSIFAGTITRNSIVGVAVITAFMLFVAVGCTMEYYRIISRQGLSPLRWIGYIAVGLMVVCSGIMSFFEIIGGFIESSLAYNVLSGSAMMAFLLIPILLIVQLWRRSEHPFGDVAHTFMPLLYIGFPLSLIVGIASTEPYMMMMVLMLVWLNDSFAYMGGSLCGRHVMWARHSPGKTWEGTAIGVVLTIVAAVIVGPLMCPDYDAFYWCAIGFVCSVIGTLGDLVESMLKRSVGVKDSGNIMPGHGGFLDRFDSLLIIMPFVFIFNALYDLFL